MHNTERSQIHDKFGLYPRDEFYEEDLLQVSCDGVLSVKPMTRALMELWKTRMGNSDTIDISSDSNQSSLRFSSTLALSHCNPTKLFEPNEIDLEIENIIEVDEILGLISLFCYQIKPIDSGVANEVIRFIANPCPPMLYGSLEVYTPTSDGYDGESYIRYRASVMLNGVSVGKVNALENMLNSGHTAFSCALETLCNSEKFRDCLIQPCYLGNPNAKGNN